MVDTAAIEARAEGMEDAARWLDQEAAKEAGPTQLRWDLAENIRRYAATIRKMAAGYRSELLPGNPAVKIGRFDQDLDRLLIAHRANNGTDVDTILGELEAAQFRLEDKPDYYDQPFGDRARTPHDPGV
jgi:hypothetical protein